MYYSVTRYLDILTCQNIQIHRPFYIVEEYFTVLMCHNYATNHLLIYRKVKAFVTQLYLALGDPMDCSLPGSSIHGILQARTLEWIAISFSRGSSWLRDRIQVSQAHSLLSEPPGKQVYIGRYIGIYSRYIGRQLPYFCYYKHQWTSFYIKLCISVSQKTFRRITIWSSNSILLGTI